MKKIRGWMLAGLLLCVVLALVCACAGAEEEHKHETITFTMWTDSLAEQQNGAGKDAHNSLPSVAGNYFLMSDVSIYTTWVVPDGVTNLCLNKKEITGPAVCVIMILPGRTLNLYDEDSGGKVSISGSTGTGNGVYNYGTFTMYGGKIEGKQNADVTGVLNYGIFTMYDGDITEHSVTSANGGGVCNYGTFTMHGGNISGNKAYHGGGVYNDGTFTMHGGKIINNSVEQQGHGYGGGVYVKSGTFSMTDGTINNNSTFEKGGGVYVDSGTFDMSGGEISNNYAGFIATGFFGGGGIYVSANGTLKMKGSLAITGNKCGTVANNDVCLANGRKITVTGQLNVNANAKIGIFVEGGDTTFTSGYKAAGNTADPSEIFSSDSDQYSVRYEDPENNEARLFKNGAHEHDHEIFTAWNSDNNLPYDNGNYYLTKDVTLKDGWGPTSNHHIRICLNGHSIIAEENSTIMSISCKAEFFDCDDQQKGCIKHAQGYTGDGIYPGDGGIFILHGGTICENETGVYLGDRGNGTFEMRGGTIRDNHAGSGGGVYIKYKGKFIMSGGTISGNTAQNMGGGVCVDNGEFIMTGGTISGNTGGMGGGVFLSGSSATCTLSGGTITGNTAGSGGGIRNYGTLNLSGNPVITGNINTDSQPDNVCPIGYPITITGELTNTTPICIKIWPQVFTNTAEANLKYNEADKFVSDNSSHMIGRNKAGQLVCGAPCKIIYDANNATGGNVPVDSKEYAKGSAVTALRNTGNLERKGYTYDEWDTQADGNGTRYAADDIFDNGGGTTLYARWIPIPAKAPAISAEPQDLALTYGYNSGSVSVTGVADAGTDYTLSYQWYSCGADGNNEAEIPGAAASSYEIPAGKPAGTTEYYLCKVTGTRIDNGLSAVTASAAAKVTVGKKALTVTAKAKKITYGDAPANDGVTYAGFVNNETETVLGGTLAYDYSYAQFGDVGNYTITPKGLTADNYEITFTNGTLTVEPLAVSITAKDGSKTYDGLQLSQPEFTVSGMAGGDTHEFTVAMTGDSTLTAAGEQPNVIATVDGAAITTGTETAVGNYLVTTADGLLEVTKKDLIIIADSDTKVYDQNPLTKDGYTSTGLAKGDNITAVTVTGSQTEVGSSDNVPSGAKIQNAAKEDVTVCYEIEYKNGTLIVSLNQGVIITADSDMKVYDGKPLTNDSYQVTGLPEGDTVESAVVTGSLTKAGTADNEVSGAKIVNAAGMDVTGNYEITYRKGTLKVIKKPLTITADSAMKTYDGTPLRKDSWTSTETAEGDTVTSVTVTGSQTEIGSGENVPSKAKIENEAKDDVTDCYQVKYRNGTLQVTDRTVVTVTAADASKVYGEQDPEMTATVSGLNGTDTLVYTVTRAAGEDAGTYVITPAGEAEQGEYAVTYVTGTFTIRKAPSSGTVTAREGLAANGQPQELVTAGTVTGGALKYAAGVDERTAPATGWITDIPTGTDARTYYVWYKVEGDSNHTDTEAACVTVTVAEPEPEPRPAPSGRLEPKVSSAGKTALKVSWNRVENVDGYDIFFSECGDTNDLNSHLYKTVSAKKTSLTIKNLKKGNSYKLRVKPFVLKKGKKKYYGEAVTIHCIAGGTDGKYTNVTAMKPKQKQLTVTVGQEKKAEAKLTLEVSGMQPLAHAGGAIAYSSSDPKVATVSADGVVKGVKAGTCKIEMRANSGVTATVKVTVTKGPKKIFFPKKEYTLKLKKKTLDLKAKLKFEPSDATLVLTWKSSAPKTASVDKNGVVTAHKKGEATITVIAANGKKMRVKIVVK